MKAKTENDGIIEKLVKKQIHLADNFDLQTIINEVNHVLKQLDVESLKS